MTLKYYKQWSGELRAEMYAIYLRLKKEGKLPEWVNHEGPCSMCGEPHNTMPHAEDYGPELEDYLRSLHVLCGRCHAMLHLRFRYAGHWVHYLNYIRMVHSGEVDRLAPIKNMNVIYTKSRYWKQIDEQHTPNPNGTWYEQLSCERVSYDQGRE